VSQKTEWNINGLQEKTGCFGAKEKQILLLLIALCTQILLMDKYGSRAFDSTHWLSVFGFVVRRKPTLDNRESWSSAQEGRFDYLPLLLYIRKNEMFEYLRVLNWNYVFQIK
jgi:hypothetical protein